MESTSSVELASHMQHHSDLIATPSPPLRSVSSSRYRGRRPPEAVYSQDEFRKGLGARLSPPEHQGDPLLDRDPPSQSPAATG